MKYNDLAKKGIEELQKMLKELTLKLGQLKFELAHQSLKNVNVIKQVKVDIARIKTALRSMHNTK